MTRRDSQTGSYTVTGPGCDRRSPSASTGLSLAITRASRAKEPATFYVRDAAGKALGYAERDEDGGVLIRAYVELRDA